MLATCRPNERRHNGHGPTLTYDRQDEKRLPTVLVAPRPDEHRQHGRHAGLDDRRPHDVDVGGGLHESLERLAAVTLEGRAGGLVETQLAAASVHEVERGLRAEAGVTTMAFDVKYTF